MFFTMLRRLEQMTLNQSMSKIANLVNDQNWTELGNLTSTLKQACGYVGASRLHFISHFIEETIREKEFEKVIPLYQQLVEECIEYKRYSRRILSDYSQIPYEESQSSRSIDISEGFTLHHSLEDDKFFCIQNGQTFSERKQISTQFKYDTINHQNESPIKSDALMFSG